MLFKYLLTGTLAICAGLFTTDICRMPALAEDQHFETIIKFNGVTMPGLPRLKEHVLKMPDLTKVLERDTDISEALFMQRQANTPYFRAADVNDNECFYKLNPDWSFSPVSHSSLPANTNFEKIKGETPFWPPSFNMELKLEDNPRNHEHAIAKLFKNGTVIGEFQSQDSLGN